MPTVPAADLRILMRELLTAAGTPPDVATMVGDSLVDSNLAGHDSHGVIRILHYLEVAAKGEVDPAAEPEIVREHGATVTVDGKWTWGQRSMWMATHAACGRAREFGIGAAVVTNSYHIGRVAPYVEHIARERMIGLAMSNAGRAVAPFGGRARVMGTNPIAWAVPRAPDREPICLDVATAYIAEGKVRVARAKEVDVPEGAIVDVDGFPTVNPNDFYNGGALLTFGGHKGSGFSILAQLVGAGLAGAHPDLLAQHRGGNGPFVIAIDVAAFVDDATFTERIEEQAAEVCGSAPAAGVERVQMPGDPELLIRVERERDGIPVPESTWAELQRLRTEMLG
ncbi:MAG: Ldh family oxidoreductase [Chloroflexota bacterium]|nr:Ldh family oxidoreductase [Chloroflexota bacterium]